MRKISTRIINRFYNPDSIIPLSFSLFILVFEWFLFRTKYRSYLVVVHHLYGGISSLHGIISAILGFIIIVLSLVIFFIFVYFAFISSWKYKIFYFLVFALAVSHEYSYQNVFKRFSYLTDLEIASNTNLEQKINAVIIFFNYWSVVPCIIFLLLLIWVKPTRSLKGINNLLISIVLLVIIPAALWFTVPRYLPLYNFPSVSLVAFVRTHTSYLFSLLTSYSQKRESVEQPILSQDYRPRNNIVFIVGESVRGDHLSLNGYHRPTTPFLDELSRQGLIHNWGIGVSGSTWSVLSHDLLISGLRMEDLPDNDEKIKKMPLIFQYAKAMRYKTHYLDGQMHHFWGGMQGEGAHYIDNHITANKFDVNNDWEIDVEIAKKTNEIINSSNGNFIFIFKNGVHFPYRDRFPHSEKKWEPSFEGLRLEDSRQEISAVINSYDNALRYNLENFFKHLVPDYKNLPSNTVIIYTGDHGQALGDDGVYHYSHGGESKSETIVPIFIIGDVGNKIDVNYKASHENLFATVLDLMNFPEELRKQKYAISLLKAKASDSKPRYYTAPTVTIISQKITDGKFKFD